jgi:hypothetical protein
MGGRCGPGYAGRLVSAIGEGEDQSERGPLEGVRY